VIAAIEAPFLTTRVILAFFVRLEWKENQTYITGGKAYDGAMGL
jgi:hypothetical protein